MSFVAGFSMVGSNGSGSTSNTLNGTIPSSAQAGDVAVVAVQSTESTPTITSLAGWTVIRGPVDLSGTSTAYLLARDVPSSGDASPGDAFSLGWSETRRLNGAGLILRGVTMTGLLSAELVDSVSTSNATIASLSSVPAGADVVAFTCLRRGASTATDITAWPSAWAIQGEVKTTFSNVPNLTTGAFYQAGTAGGTYGGGTVDTDTANLAISFTAAFPALATNLDDLRAGASTVGLRVGTSTPSKVYAGTTQVWP